MLTSHAWVVFDTSMVGVGGSDKKVLLSSLKFADALEVSGARDVSTHRVTTPERETAVLIDVENLHRELGAAPQVAAMTEGALGGPTSGRENWAPAASVFGEDSE